MSLTRKIAHNTIIQTIGKVLSTILGLVAIAMITRYLGQENFGYYTTIMAYLSFFAILIDLGLTLSVTQMISKPDADESKIFNNAFSLRFITAFVFLALSVAISLFFPYPYIVKLGIAITSASFLFISLIQVSVGVFQKKLKTDRISIAEVAGRLFLIIFTFLAIQFDWGVLGIMLAVIMGNLFNFLLVFIFTQKYVQFKLEFDLQIWKQIIISTWPLAVSIACNLIYLKTDTVILSLTQSPQDVGLYGAAYKVIDVLTSIPTLFMGLILPIITAEWAMKNLERFKSMMQKSFDFLVILAVPLAIGTLFLSQRVMIFVAGPDFADSGKILNLLIFGAVSIFFGLLFGYAVVAVEKQKQMIWGYFVAAVIGLAGYLIFIPKYSYYGAAAFTIISEAVVALLTFAMVYKTTRFAPSLRILPKIILAGLVMGLCLYYFYFLNLFLLIILSSLVYFVVLYLVKGISKELILEITQFKKPSEELGPEIKG